MSLLANILFWGIYFPLLRLLSLLLFWNRKLEERERFEKRNKFEALAHSFKEKGTLADLCFEFSSEGEFQQIAPLVMDAISEGKKIELVFFSPSVEKAVMKLAATYPKQVRYLRYPFVRLFPFIARRSFTHWVTAKTLIMVRYDLFPEFFVWSLKKDHSLKMVWVSFKKERSAGRKPSLWKKLFLKTSRAVVYAGLEDGSQGASLSVPGKSYDFRMEQIKRRIQDKDEKFKTHFALYPEFKKHLDSYSLDRRLILGNAWPSDLKLLKSIPDDFLVVIVPHQLSAEILNAFHQGLESLGRKASEIHDHSGSISAAPTFLINKKGILCELYADFSRAYVGGGFEGSIHSVLEPLVAGSQKLSCGPKHHRSTEYDLALSLGDMTEVNTPEQFLMWLKSPTTATDRDKINSLLSDYKTLKESILSC